MESWRSKSNRQKKEDIGWYNQKKSNDEKLLIIIINTPILWGLNLFYKHPAEPETLKLKTTES